MKAIVAVLTSWGAAGVFVLAILDSAGIPLPAAVDALLVATAAVNPAQAFWCATLAVAGSVTGCLGLFYLARQGGQAYLDARARGARAQRLRAWFHTYGLITVFIPCLLPVPMPLKVFVLCSGALGVSPRRFFFTVLAARIPRYFGLAFLGAQLGDNSGLWLKQHAPHLAIFAVLLAACLAGLIRFVARRKATPGYSPVSQPSK
ncbi:MAG: VTT domain-containing protein [Bryobacteraceae bacterium]|nr:VTT domain-containing protein [Bryobacteraceae bacterium]MDW8379170.1 VTT domain-containing protein [Bryobacterales bacterium]